MKKSEKIVQSFRTAIADLHNLSKAASIYADFFNLCLGKGFKGKTYNAQHREFEIEQAKFIRALLPFTPEFEAALCAACTKYPCKDTKPGMFHNYQLPCRGRNYETRVVPLKNKNIHSLKALMAWNEKPTLEKPVVMEWFLPYFEKLILKGKIDEAKKARSIFIKFTMKCEFMTEEEATGRVNLNLHYWADHAGYRQEFEKYFGVYELRV